MAQGGMTLEHQFTNFAKFQDAKADGKTISIVQVDKWFVQAEVINRELTQTDTGVCFNKFKIRLLNFQNFQLFLEDLAIRKDLDLDDLKDKLINCGLPGTDKNGG